MGIHVKGTKIFRENELLYVMALQLSKKADLGVLAFGTIDSWLIWKLTKGIC